MSIDNNSKINSQTRDTLPPSFIGNWEEKIGNKISRVAQGVKEKATKERNRAEIQFLTNVVGSEKFTQTLAKNTYETASNAAQQAVKMLEETSDSDPELKILVGKIVDEETKIKDRSTQLF
ncbi:MAG: hypothetical protein HRT47_05635 [Candidatus Caenarcaniphilales bacterium]|nr:hypothetical protein [Candidatus Caenarcaniphilales bacterium]